MTIAELYRALERHDWFYAQSDDPGVYRQGRSNSITLLTAARNLIDGEKLYEAYSKHVFSGPAFGTPKHPKPPMPTGERAQTEPSLEAAKASQ
jgi:hypothetical protein